MHEDTGQNVAAYFALVVFCAGVGLLVWSEFHSWSGWLGEAIGLN